MQCLDRAGKPALQSVAHEAVRGYLESQIWFCGRYELGVPPYFPGHGPWGTQADTRSVVWEAEDMGKDKDCCGLYRTQVGKGGDNAVQGGLLSFAGFDAILDSLGVDDDVTCEAAASMSLPYDASAWQHRKAAQDAAKAHEAARRVIFSKWAIQHGQEDAMAEAEFLAYYVHHVAMHSVVRQGLYGKVLVKFMRDARWAARERNVRKKHKLSPRFVVALLPGPVDEDFREHTATQLQGPSGLVPSGLLGSAFAGVVVMEPADGTLEGAFRAERPGVERIRSWVQQVAAALQHCHAQGVVHCNVKLASVHCVGGTLRLADLDAAQSSQASSPRGYLCGSRFSSGCLPPEAFCILKDGEESRYREYYSKFWGGGQQQRDHEEAKADAALWKRLSPRVTWTGPSPTLVVARAHLPTEDTDTARTLGGGSSSSSSSSRAENGQPPYELVAATPAADAWALGLMLFHLCAGEPLLPVNRDHDLVRDEDALRAATWTDAQLDVRIAALFAAEAEAAPLAGLGLGLGLVAVEAAPLVGPGPSGGGGHGKSIKGGGDAEGEGAKEIERREGTELLAQDLLRRLLRSRPGHRATMAEVLKHPFLQLQQDPIPSPDLALLLAATRAWRSAVNVGATADQAALRHSLIIDRLAPNSLLQMHAAAQVT